MKRTLRFGVGLALATFLTTVANASLYSWGPPVTAPGPAPAPEPVGGHELSVGGELGYNGSSVDSFSFILYDVKGNVLGTDTSFSGTVSVLSNGDLVLVGSSSGDLSATWTAITEGDKTPDVNLATFGTGSDAGGSFTGDWIPVTVPEPTTVIAGALLLLPFGASALRMLRKTRTL